MLNLVLGRKKSGKTEYLLNKLEPLVRSGEPVILLVREQYNFECQRLLLNELGPVLSKKVEIYGFTSLCNAISTKIGGVSGRVVDDSMRFLLLSRAVKEVADNLKHYTKYINSTDFINRILNIIKIYFFTLHKSFSFLYSATAVVSVWVVSPSAAVVASTLTA